LGIAPASSIKLTPFTKISSHLNVSDKQGSESLFQAEMFRALKFLADVKKLGKGEFMFTILDELFSSTNPEEGMSGAYGIVKSLADYPACMSILATHYKKLTELEAKTGGFFKNYKVYVEVKDGSISLPYQFVPGISDQSMALLLMHKQGFDKQIVDDAFGVLAQIKDDRRSIIVPDGFGER
jgi:DNA mismatch repair protein MutS